jgi:hypothetical protein
VRIERQSGEDCARPPALAEAGGARQARERQGVERQGVERQAVRPSGRRVPGGEDRARAVSARASSARLLWIAPASASGLGLTFGAHKTAAAYSLRTSVECGSYRRRG